MTAVSVLPLPILNFPDGTVWAHCPSFIVVRGVIQYGLGGFNGILEPGQSIHYKKHGWFGYAFAKHDWGVIEHMQMATGGTKRPILIPPQKRVYIHRGQWRLLDVNYQSYLDSHEQYVARIRSK